MRNLCFKWNDNMNWSWLHNRFYTIVIRKRKKLTLHLLCLHQTNDDRTSVLHINFCYHKWYVLSHLHLGLVETSSASKFFFFLTIRPKKSATTAPPFKELEGDKSLQVIDVWDGHFPVIPYVIIFLQTEWKSRNKWWG